MRKPVPTECVVFTGHSGINMSGCLARLAEYVGRRTGTEPPVIKVEGAMIAEHLTRYPADPNRVVLSRPGGFQYLLAEPKRYLSAVW